MADMGAGNVIYELRKRIQRMRRELDELGTIQEIPELVESANLLRSNEHLSKTDRKKTELLDAYMQYSDELEKMLSSVFEIQHDLQDILKEQSSLMKKARPRRKRQGSSR